MLIQPSLEILAVLGSLNQIKSIKQALVAGVNLSLVFMILLK